MVKAKKSFLLLILLIALVSSNMTAYAKGKDDGRITRSYRFTTTNIEETHDDKFKDTIEEDGKAYVLESITYNLKDKNPVMEEKKKEKVVESDPVPSGTEYKPQESFTEDGVRYTYVGMEQIGDPVTVPVTGYSDYDYAVTENEVPATKEITITNEVTGQPEKVTCSLTGVQQLPDGAWEDTSIGITFISYDSQIFEWRGHQVTKDTAYPLQGYERELLASVGADTDSYRITNISWSGQAYDNNGILCRDAVAAVQRYVRYYRANYSGTFDYGTRYRVTYQGVQKVESKDKFEYDIEAVGNYVEKAPLALYIAAGVGIVLLIGAIVFFLYFLAKKRKEKEEEDKGI